MSLPILRPYQVESVKQGVFFFRSNKIQKPRIMVAPTAAGKSIIIAAIASQLEEKVLVIQPSVELLTQNFNKYLMYDTNVAAYSASTGQRNLAKVTFATIGTIVKVPELFKEFTCLIVDEVHLYPGTGKNSMFEQFLEANPQLKMLGLTATPFRLHSSRSGSKLVMMHNSHFFANYQYIIQIQEISEHYWAKFDYIEEEGAVSKLKINTTGAEYTDKSLELYGKSVDSQIKECVKNFKGQSTLIFVPSVAQAEKIAGKYEGMAYVHGKTPDKERSKIISDFKAGILWAIVNVNVLSVGFDHPELINLVDATPTRSLSKHYQKVGRLTRPHPEGLHVRKRYVDLAGNTKRFGRLEDLRIEKIGTTHHVFSGTRKLTGELMASDYTPPPVRHSGKFEDMVITFGKVANGKKISEAPIWWLSWCLDHVTWNTQLVSNIRLFLDSQKQPQDLFAQ